MPPLNGIENIEGLTDEQKEAINKLGDGLSNKNDELLSKLNQKKEQGDLSASELEALRLFKQNAEIKTAEDESNWQESKKLLTEQHETELNGLKASGAEKDARLEQLLIDDGLSKALDTVKINPSLKAGAAAILREKISLTEGKAVAGEKSLSEYVNEWSTSDAGKAFCLAPDNNGGNANGGDGNPNPGDGDLKGNDKVRAGLKERLKTQGIIKAQ